MTLSAENIVENFDKFRSLCEKLGDRSPYALALVDNLGERLALCPASGKKEYHGAFPGGLCAHSLNVLTNAMALVKAFGWQVQKDSLIISTLMHDIGKVGYPTAMYEGCDDYYISAEEWRQQKMGEMYTYNRSIQYMDVPSRSLFLCQHFGLKLNVDETLAIKLHDGFVVEENKQYCMKAPKLAFIVMTADYNAACSEKGMF